MAFGQNLYFWRLLIPFAYTLHGSGWHGRREAGTYRPTGEKGQRKKEKRKGDRGAAKLFIAEGDTLRR